MKHLLLISYYFPPHLVPESLLAARTVKSLARQGWDVSVLTNLEKAPGTNQDYTMLRTIPSTVPIKRIGGAEHLFFRKSLVKPFFHFLGVPELEYFWLMPALLYAKQLVKTQKFDLVHSWANCHTSNVVGLMLKKVAGLPWVAHLSDPWVDNPYYSLTAKQERKCRKLEEAVIREADAIIFTTTETVDLVMAKYPPEWRQKAVVVPHGYDSDFAHLAKTKVPEKNKLRFVYTGDFYGKRSPEPFIKALYRLKERQVSLSEVQIIFVGYCNEAYHDMVKELALDDIVSFTGRLTFSESLDYAATADVLMVIDAPSENGSVFLPSKLVDYLMFEKTILGLTPGKGAAAELLRQLRCPINEPADVAGIARLIERILTDWKLDRLSVSREFLETAKKYDIDETTRDLSACFNAVMSAVRE